MVFNKSIILMNAYIYGANLLTDNTVDFKDVPGFSNVIKVEIGVDVIDSCNRL
jgi:hypothetical protein